MIVTTDRQDEVVDYDTDTIQKAPSNGSKNSTSTHIANADGYRIYALEDSSIQGDMFYLLKGRNGKEKYVTINVEGEQVDLDYVMSQAPELSPNIAKEIVKDIQRNM